MSAQLLPIRKIGKDDVSAIGYGAMSIQSSRPGVVTDEERLKLLDEVYARGCTNWDTANIYGDSEDIIGKWFKKTGKRNEVFLATKFGFTRNPERFVNGEPEYAKKCIEESLRRLGVDYIDLYYLHRPDPLVPIELTIGALKELVDEGKVRYIGLSECTADTIRRAHAVHPISAIQIEYSIFTLDSEHPDIGVVKTARELGIAIVAYSPLGHGLLTGKYTSLDNFDEKDLRRILPRFSKETMPKILEIVQSINAIATKYNATSGQVALAWLLAQGPDIIPIPGTRSIKYLNENLDATKVNLSSEDIAEIRKIADEIDGTLADSLPPPYKDLKLVDTPPLKV
ncbi:hypothetical protein EIP86_004654 [Pleurotus ostreatoroseus]|nr:hypothetical protein EIP86_004654 [Pleurotus ostreatoroseus]